MISLSDIVRQYGGHLYDSGRRALVPGPGHSKNDLSLSLWCNSDGRIIFFSHAGDRPSDVFKHLGMEPIAEDSTPNHIKAKLRRERQAAEQADRARKMRFCRKVWDASISMERTPAARYLNADRGIPIRSFPNTVRFCDAAPWSYESDKPPSPAMVAMVQDAEGQATGLHVTYLSSKGGHNGRLMFGNCRGGAVRLHTADTEIAVAEGIETAWSYAFLNERPVWALLSTSQFKTFRPPLTVDTLYVAPDMDDKLGTSLILANDMAQRFASSRPSLTVHIDAPPPGTDWNRHHRNLQGIA